MWKNKYPMFTASWANVKSQIKYSSSSSEIANKQYILFYITEN